MLSSSIHVHANCVIHGPNGGPRSRGAANICTNAVWPAGRIARRKPADNLDWALRSKTRTTSHKLVQMWTAWCSPMPAPRTAQSTQQASSSRDGFSLRLAPSRPVVSGTPSYHNNMQANRQQRRRQARQSAAHVQEHRAPTKTPRQPKNTCEIYSHHRMRQTGSHSPRVREHRAPTRAPPSPRLPPLWREGACGEAGCRASRPGPPRDAGGGLGPPCRRGGSLRDSGGGAHAL
mmetsp:Transcript_26869/g.71260  ORF Transcript_26869/g.71260 Transcript_26869/m.71260 type:complete len:233 (-) Transcript_26869:73-771(-)